MKNTYKATLFIDNNGHSIMGDVCPICGQAHNNEYAKMAPDGTMFWICPETYKKVFAVYA